MLQKGREEDLFWVSGSVDVSSYSSFATPIYANEVVSGFWFVKGTVLLLEWCVPATFANSSLRSYHLFLTYGMVFGR